MSCDEYLPGVAETINALVLEEAEEFLDYSFHSPCILVSMHSFQDVCSWYIVLLSSSSIASFLVACFDLSSTGSFQQFRRYYPPIHSHNLTTKKANSS